MEKITEISSLIIIVFTALTGILTFIEKSQKIKWKPLSKLRNGNLEEKIDNLAIQQNEFWDKLNKIEDENDIREIKRLRQYILEYANMKCEQGIKMSFEQETYFDECCEEYEKLIEKHNLTNGHTIQSIQLVHDYRKMELKTKYEKNNK